MNLSIMSFSRSRLTLQHRSFQCQGNYQKTSTSISCFVASISQADVARKAEMNNLNFISMIETSKSSGIPIKSASKIAFGHQLDIGQFAKALIKTRYPEFWDLFIYILESDNLVERSKIEEFDKSVDDFIKRIDRLPRSATR